MTAKVNYKKFLKQFRANQQIALQAAENVVNATLREMYQRIIDRTPVGDPSLWNYPAPKDYVPGTLKASWRLSINGVIRDTKGRFASASGFGNSGGISLKINGANKQSAAIYNPQPYAQRVEDGWSTQAPQGMLRITVAEFVSISNGYAVRYKTK